MNEKKKARGLAIASQSSREQQKHWQSCLSPQKKKIMLDNGIENLYF